MSDPIQAQYREKMNALAATLDKTFNKDRHNRTTFFVLLTGEFNKMDGGRVNYISNGQREDMVSALKELLARFEGRYAEGGTKQ